MRSDLLSANSRRENRQVFTTVPSLGELYHLLQVIVKELRSYSVWPVRHPYYSLGEPPQRFHAGQLLVPLFTRAAASRRREQRMVCSRESPTRGFSPQHSQADCRTTAPILPHARPVFSKQRWRFVLSQYLTPIPAYEPLEKPLEHQQVW